MIEVYDGGPVGIEAVAATMGEERDTLEDVIEPYLLQNAFVTRTRQGRRATKLAYEHLGLKWKPPQQANGDGSLFDSADGADRRRPPRGGNPGGREERPQGRPQATGGPVTGRRHLTFSSIVLITSLLGGCTSPRKPGPESLWYMGSRGDSDYFHQGRSPTEGRNYRLPTGQLDMGGTFPLTFDSSQWQRIKRIEQPSTMPTSQTAGQ